MLCVFSFYHTVKDNTELSQINWERWGKPHLTMCHPEWPNPAFWQLDNKKVAEVAAPVADKSKVKKNRVKRAEDAPKKPMAPFFCY